MVFVSCCKEEYDSVKPDRTITIDKGRCQYVYSEYIKDKPIRIRIFPDLYEPSGILVRQRNL